MAIPPTTEEAERLQDMQRAYRRKMKTVNKTSPKSDRKIVIHIVDGSDDLQITIS